MCAQRGVSMVVLVNSHSCGVGVSRAPPARARRHRIPYMHILFASTHDIIMSDQTNEHTYISMDITYDMYVLLNEICSLKV